MLNNAASHNTLQQELDYNANGLSAVHTAAIIPNIEMTRLLLEYGADFSKISDKKFTQLNLVSYFNV